MQLHTQLPIILLLFLLSFKAIHVNAQFTIEDTLAARKLAKEGERLLSVPDYDSAQIVLVEAAELYKKYELWGLYLEQTNNVCYAYFFQERYDEIIDLVNESLALVLPHFPEKRHREIGNAYNYFGLAYNRKEYINYSIKNYERALSVWRNMGSYVNPNVYFDLAIKQNELGDAQSAIKYMDKFVDMTSNRSRGQNYEIAHEYLRFYGGINEYDKAIESGHQALNILSTMTDDPDVGFKRDIVLTDLSGIYFSQGEIEKAIQVNHQAQASLYCRFGLLSNFYDVLEQEDSAEYYALKSLETLVKSRYNTNQYYGIAYERLAKLYCNQKKYQLALDHAQQSIIHHIPFYEDQDVLTNPDLETLINRNHTKDAFFYKARALVGLGLKNNDPTLYDKGIETYTLCFQVMEELRTDYEGRGAKSKQAIRFWSFFETAIRDCLAIYQQTQKENYLKKAWEFSERSKSQLLKDALITIMTKNTLGLPDSIIDQEYALKAKIDALTVKINDAKDRQKGKRLKQLSNERFEAEAALSEFKKKLATQYPDYHQLKYQAIQPNIAKVQEQLEKNEASIHYFVGRLKKSNQQSMVYCFVISKDAIFPYQFEFDSAIINQIQKFRACFNPDLVRRDPSKAYQAYTTAAYALYEQIFKPIHDQLPKTISKLTIIPDAELSYLPFELLVTQKPSSSQLDYRNLPYLLNQFQISYAYSNSFESDFNNPFGSAEVKGVLAFAPSYGEIVSDEELPEGVRKFRGQLTPLVWNTKEAEQIQQHLPTTMYLSTAASETQFKKEAANYQILHLAMHALVDDQNPMHSKLVFDTKADTLNDGYLNLYELYGMQIKADLVVLSACETGFGKYIRGEGIASLGRAFAYAGCPNVVMSHWSVDDQATSQLMKFFYQGIAAGKTKSDALRRAKLAYLNEAQPNLTHPVYWGAFVLVGKDTAIQQAGNWLWPIALLILIIGVGGFIIKKKIS
ncbi:MAG: CHAT domain-containing protein [Flammeovirgaceae bacterium]